MCPLSLSSLKDDAGIAAAGAADSEIPNFDRGNGPAIQSAVRPFVVCHAFSFASVPGPKFPSAARPSFS